MLILMLWVRNTFFNGGNIKSAVFKAASRAALRADEQRIISMADLSLAAEEERKKI